MSKKETSLSCNTFALKRKTYKNAISIKFDNRRVTVAKTGKGFVFEFRIIDNNYSPACFSELIHGKLSLTTIQLSKEASEIVMMSLAELMGFDVVKKIKSK
jgi:hypothetical protein